MKTTVSAVALATACAVPAVALAQSDEEPAVVVTATRFAAPALETPIGVQVITAADIRELGASSVAEVLDKLGDVHTRINFLGTPDAPLDLRGFGVTGDQNTLVLLDGQRVSENELASARLSGIPLDAIERIEILRGAGAVLYGGGATAGTIHIITKPAGAAAPATGTLHAGAGSHATRELRASGAVSGDAFGLALHASHQDSDNYRANNAASQDNASGEWRLAGDGASLALRFGAERQRSRLPGARSEAQLASDRRGTATPNDHAQLDGWQLGLTGERTSGALTLAADLGLRAKDSRSHFEFTGGSFDSELDSRVASVSPRLKWAAAPGGMDNVLIAGLDFSDWDYTNDSVLAFFGFPTPTRETATQRNQALYVQDHLQLSPATRLAAGWRHERVRISTGEALTPIPRRVKTDGLNAFDLSVRQRLRPGLVAVARIGRSFRVANVDENRCFFPPCADLLEPQKSRDREIALEYRRSGARVRAALFDIALANELHFVPLVGFGGQNINLSPTRRRGLELDAGFRLHRTLEVSARYALTDARFRTGSYGGVDVSGNEVPLVARRRAGATLGWQAGAHTRLLLAVSHVGTQRYDNDQANRFRKMPAYTTADVKLSHEIGKLRLAAAVNNLFDRKYYSYAIVDSPTTPTTFNAYPERERSVLVSAELRFD